MDGLMMSTPLSMTTMFDRAEQLFPTKEIVTATPSGKQRTTYGEWAERTRRLGNVLDQLGISATGRVATFAWNTARHLELYFAPRAADACRTRSTCDCFPSNSPTSSTTPTTRSSSSTVRLRPSCGRSSPRSRRQAHRRDG